jgi:pterin-4a-carbinolamine dehydratase
MNYRIRKSGEVIESSAEMVNSLAHFRKIFEAIQTKMGKPLSKLTIDAYIARLNRLHVLVTGKPIESKSLAWLTDVDSVIEKLKASDLGSKKDYLSPVIKLLDQAGEDQAIIKKYSMSLSSLKENEDEKRGNNQAHDEVVKGFVDLKEVDSRIDGFVKKIGSLTDDELVKLLIVCMYYRSDLIPRNDLNIFKLVDKSKAGKKMNDEFNYILTDKRGANLVATGIVMNNYKTRGTYGRQKFGITPTLGKVLYEYFKRWNKANGDYLFVNLKNEPFSKTHFLGLLRQATESILGKQQTIDGIRRAIITEFHSKGMRTINEVEEFAKRFLHSPDKNREYMSVNLTKDD